MLTLQVFGGDQHQMDVTEENTLLDVLMHAQAHVWGESQRLTKIEIDGEVLETLDEAALIAIPARDQTVTVWLEKNEMTQDIGQLIEEAAAYLNRLESGFAELAELFRGQGTKQQFQMMTDAMVGLTTILELVQTLFSNEGVPDELVEAFKAFLGELNEKSLELTEAQESEDLTLIADILEYEFVDVIQLLKQHLEHVTPYIKQTTPDP
ncbi:hypothetical protein [Acanthopleuribacter pedis]|uniref:DUF8042 domain-containing protein n=1 Tax=Acanthopleuribacter pedis TaxID=442870 RepID=A0A8J7Q2A5_9BACT|nr:hypothetical protein [Acanthopleuribacter pedis]MBO1319207.1 hypothetical protein [Acanthopleuribacter pedis]